MLDLTLKSQEAHMSKVCKTVPFPQTLYVVRDLDDGEIYYTADPDVHIFENHDKELIGIYDLTFTKTLEVFNTPYGKLALFSK